MTRDPSILGEFALAQQLCTAYPRGLGLYCSGHRFDYRRPFTHETTASLDVATRLLRHCAEICHCPDGASSSFAQQNATNEGSVASNVNRGQASDQESIPQDNPEQTRPGDQNSDLQQPTAAVYGVQTLSRLQCNGMLYGSPLMEDCAAALEQQPFYNLPQGAGFNEYVRASAASEPTISGSNGVGIIHTPLYLASGKTLSSVLAGTKFTVKMAHRDMYGSLSTSIR